MLNLIRRNQNRSASSDLSFDPFQVMEALLRTEPLRDGSGLAAAGTYVPPFDVREEPDAYIIQGDLPGVRESDVEVTVTGNVVTVTGTRAPGAAENRYHVLERTSGSFSRVFGLPDGAAVDDVRATLESGVLTLHIPKRPEVQPRKISLNGQSSRAAS